MYESYHKFLIVYVQQVLLASSKDSSWLVAVLNRVGCMQSEHANLSVPLSSEGTSVQSVASAAGIIRGKLPSDQQTKLMPKIVQTSGCRRLRAESLEYMAAYQYNDQRLCEHLGACKPPIELMHIYYLFKLL